MAEAAHLAQPRRVALLGVFVNGGLALVKLLAGVFGNSFALVADAAESLVDILGSLVVWGGLRYGDRPPDAEHPFGHGKAEALAALSVGVLIVVTGFGIAAEAVRQILTPHTLPAAFTLVVLLVVVAVKETMFRVARRSARLAGGAAGHADAWHHRSDAITSLFALLGITVAVLGGERYAVADDVAALAASGVIVLNGVLLLREPLAELMDRHAEEVAAAVRAVAVQTPDVRGVEQCVARRSGRFFHAVLHVEVDPAMSVADSHRLTGIIKARIRAGRPNIASVLIHIEPHEPTVRGDDA